MSILKYKDANGQWQKIGIPAGADMQSSIYDPQNKKQDIFKYVDDKIGEIPTPDVSAQISAHNNDAAAHPALQTLIGQKENSGVAATAVSTHNTDTSAHADIRQAIASINPVPYTVSATAPSNTSIFWIDTANSNALKFYDGSAWVAVGAIWG